MVWLWLVAAVVQGAFVIVAGWLIWRQRDRNVPLATGLIVGGLLIVAVNARWLIASAPTGGPSMGMRGGMPGVWLSNLMAVELLGLALLALGKPRR